MLASTAYRVPLALQMWFPIVHHRDHLMFSVWWPLIASVVLGWKCCPSTSLQSDSRSAIVCCLQILHVSGLMESVTREQLRELFSQAGEVTKVDIPDGGRSMVSGDF